MRLWLEPLSAAGIEEGRLVVEGLPIHIGYVSRRYGKYLGQLIRDTTPLAGLRLKVKS